MKDLLNLMGKAKEMQARFQAMQEEIASLEATGKAGGGLVGVTLSGKFEMRKLEIDPSLSESLRQESQGRIKVTTIRPTGVPTTGLVGSIVNFEAGAGIMGAGAAEFGERFGAIMEGRAPAEWSDRECIEYFSLVPEDIAEQIVFAINQPWGVSISDLTVRASGDMYVI